MGLVMTKVKITNMLDRQLAERGLIPSESIRQVEIEALADTGAIPMAIPEDVAELLGASVTRHDTVTQEGIIDSGIPIGDERVELDERIGVE